MQILVILNNFGDGICCHRWQCPQAISPHTIHRRKKLDVNETIIKLDGSSIQYQQWWRVGHFKAEFSGSFAPKPVVAISASVLWVTTANPPTGGEIFKKIQALKYWIMPGFHGISQNLVKNRQARMIRFDFFSNFWHPKTVPSLCGNLLSSHH